MPVTVRTAEEQQGLIAKLDSMLGAILEEKEVRTDVQAAIAALRHQDL